MHHITTTPQKRIRHSAIHIFYVLDFSCRHCHFHTTAAPLILLAPHLLHLRAISTLKMEAWGRGANYHTWTKQKQIRYLINHMHKAPAQYLLRVMPETRCRQPASHFLHPTLFPLPSHQSMAVHKILIIFFLKKKTGSCHIHCCWFTHGHSVKSLCYWQHSEAQKKKKKEDWVRILIAA